MCMISPKLILPAVVRVVRLGCGAFCVSEIMRTCAILSCRVVTDCLRKMDNMSAKCHNVPVSRMPERWHVLCPVI